jgi:hypothetical protein
MFLLIINFPKVIVNFWLILADFIKNGLII